MIEPRIPKTITSRRFAGVPPLVLLATKAAEQSAPAPPIVSSDGMGTQADSRIVSTKTAM